MSTGITTVDSYFNCNYEKIKDYCNKYNIDEDKINDVYVNMKKRLTSLTGLTDTEYFQYVRRSIWNSIRDDARKRKRRGFNVYIEDENVNLIEKKLLEEDFNNQEYINEIQYLTKMLFKYIDERGIYDDREVFILKSYAWTTKSYDQLEKEIGISKNICKKTMMKFRNDLRFNFVKWLNKKQNGNK